MNTYVSAKEFSERTGYPLKKLCRLIRNGEIPHEKEGAGYRLNLELACEAINKVMTKNAAEVFAMRPQIPEEPKFNGELTFIEKLKLLKNRSKEDKDVGNKKCPVSQIG